MINFYNVLKRAKRIESPTSELKWGIYVLTVRNWINSCQTIEQLETTLPFIAKYHMSPKRNVIQQANLYNLFNLKSELIITENHLEKVTKFLDKYDSK